MRGEKVSTSDHESGKRSPGKKARDEEEQPGNADGRVETEF